MSPPDDERRYSDEEFALILRTASEVEESPTSTSVPAPPRDGLTLSEIQEIAREVGIDPRRISRAAVLLAADEPSGLIRLIGGSPRHRHEHVVDGEVGAGDLGRVIEVARRVFASQGETREVLGGVEWKGGTGTTSLRIALTPREKETTIQASVDRTEAMAGVYAGIGLPVTLVIGVTLGKLVFGESDAGVLAALVSGLVPSMVLARAMWKRSTRRWRERLLRLMDDMTREAEEVARHGDEDAGEYDALPPSHGVEAE